MTLTPPRVHILGLGSIGAFAAHCLSSIPSSSSRPPITLLLHRRSLAERYVDAGRAITLHTHTGETVPRSGFDVEVLEDGQWYADPTTTTAVTTAAPIDHLIVCTKTINTVDALRPLIPRLSPLSTILFLQNGCGVISVLNSTLFPNAATRPNYIVGVISHGVGLNRPFDITHTGFAATSLGLVPRSDTATTADSYLLHALPQSPTLNATSHPYLTVFQHQLEKLAVNAFCNPHCALADAPNGYLFSIPAQRRAILSEISAVALALPELQNVTGVKERFAVETLEATVGAVIEKTRATTCSMVWDLRAGRRTEVRFINGYWVRRGREVGVATPVNEELVRRVEERGGWDGGEE